MISTWVGKRIQKAYPKAVELIRKEEEAEKGKVFAAGCGFYKIVLLFFVGAFLGDITETIFCRITAGVWMSRSSVVWGPFSIVWGLAIALVSWMLYQYRNRSDRFLACVAYLDGIHPSVVMCRGYYTRTVLAAFDWDGKELKQRWVFDSNNPGCKDYAGQGNHNLRVGDVDGDGCDEIIYGSCAIDHNGKGLYTTKMGHGDAIHLTHFDPSRKGLQVWDCHENKRDGSTYRDAATGEVLFQIKDNTDVGRCMAADIDPTQPGVEMWSVASGGIRNVKGEVVKDRVRGLSCNMAVWRKRVLCLGVPR
jgi:hypothetical protein